MMLHTPPLQLATCSEDAIFSLWVLPEKGHALEQPIEHVASHTITDHVPVGIAFTGPRFKSLTVPCFDSHHFKVFSWSK